MTVRFRLVWETNRGGAEARPRLEFDERVELKSGELARQVSETDLARLPLDGPTLLGRLARRYPPHSIDEENT